jgi:hypothetical protein
MQKVQKVENCNDEFRRNWTGGSWNGQMAVWTLPQ